jgi:hypothetical protein
VIFNGGLTVKFTSETDPPSRDTGTSGSVQIHGEHNIVHRIFVDREHAVYFGYDLEVEPVPGTDQFTLTIKSLSEPPISSGVRRPQDLTARSLPTYPSPQLIHDGDTLAVDVLVNQNTGMKIIDLIKVSARGEAVQSVTPTPGGIQVAKDLSLEMISLGVTNSRLLVNGQRVFGTEEGAGPGVSGTVLWFYLRGYGRFIIALTPREGYAFQGVGVVQGHKLSFSMGGNRFEWVSSSVIAPCAGGALNLWVLPDPQYEPDVGPDQSPYQVGALGVGGSIKRLLNDR